MRAVRWVLLLVVAIGAALIGVEVVARVAGVTPHLGWSDVPLALAVPDRKLGYVLPASTTVSYAGVPATLDADGMRNPPGGSGPTEILVLGDERTFGWGVADGDTYPARLGEWLRTRCPTCGRVVNAGIPGYTTYEGMLLARDLGTRLRPRLVIASFGLNDAILDGAPSPQVLPPPLVQASAAAGWLYDWLRRPGHGWWQAIPRTTLMRFSRNMRALVSEVRRFGGVPVLLNIGYGANLPDPGADSGRRLRRGRLEDDYHGSTRVVSDLEYAPLVDVIGEGLDATTMLDAIHPNAEGHRRIAQALGDRLVAEGLVTP